jgi:uncharacterized protein (TIGR02246 family)
MKTAIFSGIVAAFLALGGLQNVGSLSPAEAADKAVEDAIKAKIEAYEKAFNMGDAPALSRMWAPDGSYINTDGWVSTGRDQLEKLHAHILSDKPKQTIKVYVGSITQSANDADAVVERGIAVMRDASGGIVSRSPYIAIHRKIGGEWLLQSVVEMSTQTLPAQVTDLNWMLGSWKASNADNSVTLTNTMQPSGHLMVSDIEVTQGKSSPQHEMIMTTVDPGSGKLTAFLFDANGGYGRGIWHQNQGKWYLNTHRTKPDGTTLDAVIVMKRDSDNTMSWQTVGRTADGITLKDLPEVVVTRTSTK